MKTLLGLLAAGALLACGSDKGEPERTSLPTRQTAIDPVVKKVDTAREDAERRRQQTDDAAR